MAGGRGTSGAVRAGRVALAGLVLLAACATPSPRVVPEEVLAPLIRRVQAVRGVAIAPAIDARFLSPREVRGRIETEMGRVVGPKARAATTALLRSLGWIQPEGDPWEAWLDLQAQSVAGFYSVLDGRLYVVARDEHEGRDVLTDPFAEQVLVHELAHAFQAAGSQLPELGLGLEGFDDAAFALAAVLEGDALWTEHRDAERTHRIPPPDAEAFARRFEIDVEGMLPEGSPWVRAMFLRPYSLGYRWVWRVGEAEGADGLMRMLAEPPLTSAALLHPDRRRRGRNEIEARGEQFAPDEHCRTRTTSSFGEIGLGTWFEAGATPPPEIEAWRADRAWLLECPTGDVLAWLLLLDRPEAATALEPRVRERAMALPSGAAQVERSGARLLVHRGLDETGRRWLLGQAPVRFYPDLTAWLAAHPEILEASARLREGAPRH